MGRVSLTESYDDRSVISKLNEMDKRVTENTTVVTSAEASAKASAQAAQETADRFAGSVGAVVQNANAQINASKAQVDQAKAEVDATVTTVAQAVQTANNASASAQQSATTVATYDTRLTAVEGHVTTLETADGQNVKLTGDQTINGIKHFADTPTAPTTATGLWGVQVANGQKVKNELDNYPHMLRTTGNQTKTGALTLTSQLIIGDKVNPGANVVLYGKSGNRRIIFQNIEEDITVPPTEARNQNVISWCDKNGQQIVNLGVFRNPNGSTQLMVYMLKSDGTYTWKTIVTSE